MVSKKDLNGCGRVFRKFFETSWLYHFDKLMLFKLKSFEIKVKKQCIFDNNKNKSRPILQFEKRDGPNKELKNYLNFYKSKGNSLG